MTKLEKEVLNFFCFIELFLGIWMLTSKYYAASIIYFWNLYIPLWILGCIYIVGAAFELSIEKKLLWRFVVLVSMPLAFLAGLFLQEFILLQNDVLIPGVIVFTMIGAFSAIYAGKVFPRGKKA